jgi:uncharacterized protein (TIGR03437 family)
LRIARVAVGLYFLLGTAFAAAPAIYDGGVVNGADFTPYFSPGIIFSVFGMDLAPGTKKAPGFPLPGAIDGVSVEIIDGAGLHGYREPATIQVKFLPAELFSAVPAAA